MFEEIWVLIPLAPFALGALAIWTRHQSKMAEKYGHLPKGIDAAPATLRNRDAIVAVLEQITTDGHSTKQLESEIEQLRDR